MNLIRLLADDLDHYDYLTSALLDHHD